MHTQFRELADLFNEGLITHGEFRNRLVLLLADATNPDLESLARLLTTELTTDGSPHAI